MSEYNLGQRVNDAQPKQGWAQYHVGTAVVMLVVAGLLTGEVLKRRNDAPEHARPEFIGWPCKFGYEVYYFNPDFDESKDIDFRNFGHWEWKWDYFPALPIDIAACLAIVVASGVVAEILLRRHERSKF